MIPFLRTIVNLTLVLEVEIRQALERWNPLGFSTILNEAIARDDPESAIFVYASSMLVNLNCSLVMGIFSGSCSRVTGRKSGFMG